jgi:hypothetical protein
MNDGEAEQSTHTHTTVKGSRDVEHVNPAAVYPYDCSRPAPIPAPRTACTWLIASFSIGLVFSLLRNDVLRASRVLASTYLQRVTMVERDTVSGKSHLAMPCDLPSF